MLLLFAAMILPHAAGLTASTWASSVIHAVEHMFSPPMKFTPLEEIANTRIPTNEDKVEILAFVAKPSVKGPSTKQQKLPVLILIHEFFGLSPSIRQKAQGLAEDLGCLVVAPDTFRGTSTEFIPKAIWLALTTPQDRVNKDLDTVCEYLSKNDLIDSTTKVAVMGFCYGGGKALRYTIERRPSAATVVCYGSPVSSVEDLKRLEAPVCGIFGRDDVQFPMPLLEKFKEALNAAQVENDIQIYDGVGHAFWSDMEEIERGDEPQLSAYRQCTNFLRQFFFGQLQ